MVDKDVGKQVHESYIRAGGRAFISVFYDHLMQSSEAIREKFEKVDMEIQTDNLARAIVMSFLFVDQNHQTALHTMDRVRESHNRHNLDIKPELYDVWLNCLIETVAKYDPQANEELLQQWHRVMSASIDHIRNGY